MHERRLRRSPDVVQCELEEGGVLLDLRTGAYFGVNETGAVVWDLLAGATSVDDIVAGLARRVDDDVPPAAGEAVRSFVDALADRGLVVVDPAP